MAFRKTTMNLEKIPDGAGNDWVAAMPYFQTLRAATPLSDLPPDGTSTAGEVTAIARSLSQRTNQRTQSMADGGDYEAAFECGVR